MAALSHGVNLVVEVADVTHDRLVLHLEDVVERDDVAIAGGRHVDVADAERVFERGDWMISMFTPSPRWGEGRGEVLPDFGKNFPLVRQNEFNPNRRFVQIKKLLPTGTTPRSTTNSNVAKFAVNP